MALLAAAGLALLWANSPWSAFYDRLFHLPVTLQIGTFRIAEDLRHWINDGLMAVFFFQVALEIKREFLHGELATPRQAALPIAAALGGMILPAGLFLVLNFGQPGARGWGIPMATDIAFAVGMLALLGRRVPAELRLFLLAFAIVDDIGAILVIAVYYTQHFSLAAFLIAGLCLALMAAMRRLGLWSPVVYLLPALVFWAAVLKSGVHATIAGVVLGAMTPASARMDLKSVSTLLTQLLAYLRNRREMDYEETQVRLGRAEEALRDSESPLERMERLLSPWVSFLVLPVFALANAGVTLSGDLLRESLSNPLTRGILVGLILGKVLGITGASWLAARLGLAVLPRNVTWRHVAGAGLLGGIGFTVSLFISGLAFADETLMAQAKIGILAASSVAAVAGYWFLRAR
jgi:NhaA family Na+:H+ antiporter